MSDPRPIRWLHLSDLHLGCRGKELWWQVREELRTSIVKTAQRLGAPDLVLFTGDLTNRGTADEFDQVDLFLEALLGWLREADPASDPVVLAVPGNHDLLRPTRRFAYKVLDHYLEGADNEDVRLLDAELWDERDASFLEPLFAGYLEWLGRRVRPQLEERAKAFHVSHFPGDFTVELAFDGAFPLTVVGLNSTWLQYRGGEFERRLEIPLRQFHAALASDGETSPLDVLKRTQQALLLMHHPVDWLSRRGRKTFHEAIYPPDRFALCLHGHMHEARSEAVAVSGGKPRYYFQALSLFGLERLERAVGYSWGTLTADGTVRMWPFQHVVRGSGEGAFVHDTAFHEDPDGVRIRPLAGEKPPQPPSADLRSYLEDLLATTDHVNVSGIAVSGEGKSALRHPIERLYTPLRCRAADLEAREVALASVLPRFPRLLIEGQPGAGKTTFLRFVAAMLARDALGQECPDGRSWRRRYLGLDDTKDVPAPVFLRIGDLVAVLTEASAGRPDDRLWLLELLDRWCAGKHEVDRDQWQKLLEEGRAILLLDGLDEVADERLRQRVFEIFRDACKRWPGPMVVTSRPIQTAALKEIGFELTTIEPFGEAEIGTFIDHWVEALYGAVQDEGLGAEGEQYLAALRAAIVGRSRVRLLATNPVMLTCLCVVHWNEGRLPEGRARVYRAVLRWLIASRSALRDKEGLTERFAWRAFARLALHMMTTTEGKQSVLDLEGCAVAVDPVMRRHFPNLDALGRRDRARDWLRAECLESGVVEEVAGNRIRFWHLTFQEFLAALELAWRGDGDDHQDEDWWPVVEGRLDDVQWRETVEMFPGCLHEEGGEGRVDRLLERVLELRGEQPDLAAEARVAGIVGRLLEPLKVFQYQPPTEIQAAFSDALERSMAIFTREGARRVPVKDRIAAAEALGRGGDPRLAPERDNFLEVPGLDVRLGKYPVTVEEYQRFVESGGYEEEDFWDAEGWGHRKSDGWEAPRWWDEQLTTPNRPVMGVSWYEAVAYCRWLSRLRGEEIRLPTEAEWKRTATPARGEYPWGAEKPDAERANFRGNIGAATPVGVYPTGDAPYGHCDLGGNVWEWCSDSAGEKFRVLRGGCWYNPAENLRAAGRGRSHAANRGDGIGFRLAAAPPSLES